MIACTQALTATEIRSSTLMLANHHVHPQPHALPFHHASRTAALLPQCATVYSPPPLPPPPPPEQRSPSHPPPHTLYLYTPPTKKTPLVPSPPQTPFPATERPLPTPTVS